MKVLTWLLAAITKKQLAARPSSSHSDAEFMDVPMRMARERTQREQQQRAAQAAAEEEA